MYVEMKNVQKNFGNFRAADNVSFSIEKGKLIALLGPSGSGKTTILRMIAGLEKPDAGEIYIGGQLVNNIVPSERGIGFVFQNYALFRYMTVYENIAFGLQVKKQSPKAVKKRVEELLELTDLQNLGKRYPNELSGGQMQRVAFARALAPEPHLLLLDEPFAAIDTRVRTELRRWLRDMIHQVGITSIFVTHDQDEAVEVADGIIITNHGRVEQSGTADEIYKNPQTAFVANFVGEPVVVKNFGNLNGFEQEGFESAIIRPEFVEAFKSDNMHFKGIMPYAQKGKIKDIIFKGNALELKLDVDGMELVCHRSLERRGVKIGEVMNVVVYRLYAISGRKVELKENVHLKAADPDGSLMEKYLYGEGNAFAVQ